MSYPGVHAEARPVPAEHISGPVPAVTPQEGPRAAQVHRGRNVRAVSNPNNKKDYSMATDTLTLTHHAPQNNFKKKKKNLNTRADNSVASDTVAVTDLALIATASLGPPTGHTARNTLKPCSLQPDETHVPK